MAIFRKLLLCALIPLPQPLKRLACRRLLGWEIGEGATVGLSYVDARMVTLGRGVHIGHFNVIRHVKRLAIGDRTYIANFNSFYGSQYEGEAYRGELRIGADVQFMSRHFLDVTGSITIGDRAVIGGRETQFWSHQVAPINGEFALEPGHVEVGEDVYIGARAMLLGCRVPPRAVVGAGSVVTKSFEAEDARLLIAGNPAAIRKRYAAPTVGQQGEISDAISTQQAESLVQEADSLVQENFV